jgi:hypothetical protein
LPFERGAFGKYTRENVEKVSTVFINAKVGKK